MKLYIYEHCPYCVRARMIFGFKNIVVENVFLLNDDEATPISMIGQKMVPILEKDDGSYMAESLDIVAYIDNTFTPQVVENTINGKIETWIEENRSLVHKLTMPLMIKYGFPEFATQASIDYFVRKKSAYVGDFTKLEQQQDIYLVEIEKALLALDTLLTDYQVTKTTGYLTITDLILFPVLRNITMNKHIKLPPMLQTYVADMAKQSKIALFS